MVRYTAAAFAYTRCSNHPYLAGKPRYTSLPSVHSSRLLGFDGDSGLGHSDRCLAALIAGDMIARPRHCPVWLSPMAAQPGESRRWRRPALITGVLLVTFLIGVAAGKGGKAAPVNASANQLTTMTTTATRTVIHVHVTPIG